MAENEEHSEEQKRKIYHAISLVIIGIGVGWLTGLSISPVVAGLLSSIIGAVLVLAAVLSGFSYGDNASLIKNISDISPVPFALLMVGIIAGTSSGVWVRTHNVLGVISVEKQDNSFTKLQGELTQLKEQEGKWKGLDIPLSEIAQRILDKYYPEGDSLSNSTKDSSNSNKTATPNPENLGFLYSAKGTNNVCDEVRGFPKSVLRNEIRNKNRFILFRKISDIIHDDTELEKTINVICEQIENSVESKE